MSARSAHSRPHRRRRSTGPRRLDRTRVVPRAQVSPKAGASAQVDERTVRERLLGGPHAPVDWVRAVLAGLEGLLVPWLLVVVPALLAYVMTADAPALGEANWGSAVRLATGLHLTAAGGGLSVGAGDDAALVTLTPLGLTLVQFLSLRFAAKRRGIADVPRGLVTVATVVVVHLVLAALLGVPGAAMGGLVGGSALLAGLAVLSAAPALLLRDRWPGALRRALAGAAWALLALVLLGLALVVTAGILGRTEILGLYESVTNDALGAVLLTLVQLLYVPVFLVWAVSFAAGPGFHVGTGTQFTVSQVDAAPLPAVPALGALPGPGDPGLAWMLALVPAVGLLVGYLFHSRRRADSARDAALSAGLVAVLTGLGAAALGVAASGSVGPGRMDSVGVPAALFGLVVAAEIGLPALLLAVGLHPDLHRGRAGDTDATEETEDMEYTEDTEDTEDTKSTVAVDDPEEPDVIEESADDAASADDVAAEGRLDAEDSTDESEREADVAGPEDADEPSARGTQAHAAGESGPEAPGDSGDAGDARPDR